MLASMLMDGVCFHHYLVLREQVHREANNLFKRHDRSSRFSEWPSLRADLQALARPADPSVLLAVHQRMVRTYKVFQR